MDEATFWMKAIWLIPVFPFAGALVNGIFGKFLPKRMVHWVGCTAIFLSLLFSIAAIHGLTQLPPEARSLKVAPWVWIPGGAAVTSNGFLTSLNVEWGFRLDPLSAVMLFVVTFVGFLIHVYSIGYMWEEKEYGYWRFFAYLNLFASMMLLLVLGSNLFMMFIGWEGVGLCSYLLIGYYYRKKSAADAGKKAFIVNRIGDFGFALAIMLAFTTFGTVDFAGVQAGALAMFPHGGTTVFLIALLMFVGACGKSAQIPLYVWLPDAMEGPTPVSALIHAATMVTSGIYMISRMNALYSLSPQVLLIVAAVGALTAIFAASIGLVQNDIKRVLAYSTVSQLGYMFMGLGAAAYAAGMFHLMTHAFFKACLFLGSGSVILALHHEQDMRRMGQLRRYLPHTYRTFLIATIAIAGIPFFAGFFSKDEILWKTFEKGYLAQNSFDRLYLLFWALGLVAAGMTAFYMFRLVYLTFFGADNVPENVKHHGIMESPRSITVPLWILAIGSMVAGLAGIPHALGGFINAPNLFEEWLEPVFSRAHGGKAEHGAATAGHHGAPLTYEYLLMVLSVGVAVAGIWVATRWYRKRTEIPAGLSARFQRSYQTLLNKYFVDEIYDSLFVNPIKKLCLFCWKFDARIVDGLVNFSRDFTVHSADFSKEFDDKGVDGTVDLIEWLTRKGSGVIRRLQTGQVSNYAFMILLGFFLMVGALLYREHASYITTAGVIVLLVVLALREKGAASQ